MVKKTKRELRNDEVLERAKSQWSIAPYLRITLSSGKKITLSSIRKLDSISLSSDKKISEDCFVHVDDEPKAKYLLKTVGDFELVCKAMASLRLQR